MVIILIIIIDPARRVRRLRAGLGGRRQAAVPREGAVERLSNS